MLEKSAIDFLIVADRAEVVSGRLYLMGGGWERLYVADFSQPVALGLAVGVLVPWAETNVEQPLAIAIEHEDGTKVTPDLTVKVNVGRPANAVRGQSFRAMIAINGLFRLPAPGSYRIAADLAGKDVKRVTFHASKQ